jgi:hypothetical protein
MPNGISPVPTLPKIKLPANREGAVFLTKSTPSALTPLPALLS